MPQALISYTSVLESAVSCPKHADEVSGVTETQPFSDNKYKTERPPALLFSAIGEVAAAYVAIAVSSRVRRMRNGNLN